MITRILHTRFWSDPFIFDCSPSEKLMFLFLVTNQKVNMCGIYEISSKEISFFTGIPPEEIKQIAKKFQDDKKIFFWKGWVGILNHLKYQRYGAGDQSKAFTREVALIPPSFWQSMQEWDTSLYTSLYTSATLDRIQNTEYRIPNKEIRKVGSSVSGLEDLDFQMDPMPK